MPLLDTNALIAVYKTKNKKEKTEKLFTTVLNVIEFPIASQNDNLIILFPSPESYLKAIEYSSLLRNVGTPIAAIDIMIGVLALEHDLTIVTDDKDFSLLSKIEPKLLTINVSAFLEI